MKMSLKLMTYENVSTISRSTLISLEAHIFMPQMFEELELTVCAFRQDRGAKWLHDLLHGDGLASQLVSRRALRHRTVSFTKLDRSDWQR